MLTRTFPAYVYMLIRIRMLPHTAAVLARLLRASARSSWRLALLPGHPPLNRPEEPPLNRSFWRLALLPEFAPRRLRSQVLQVLQVLQVWQQQLLPERLE